mgnify:CR=1 FL=1
MSYVDTGFDPSQWQFDMGVGSLADSGQMSMQPDYMSWGDFGGSYGADQYSDSRQGGGYAGMNVGGGGYAPSGGFDQYQYGGETTAPSGQQTGSGGAQNKMKEDEWKKLLMKFGMGSVAPALISAAGRAMSPTQQQKSSSMPMSPAAAYQFVEPVPEPGTKASPLISGRPKQTNISQGLEERVRRGGKTGGFSMF